jgi:hypothetical protein
MIEADLNAAIARSLRAIGGWGFKIPDAAAAEVASNYSWKRPYDIIGFHPVIGGVAIESKFNQGQTTFAFSRFEEHQIWNLRTISETIQAGAPGAALACFGAWEPRKYFEAFFFDFALIAKLISMNLSSVSRKDLSLMRDKGKVFEIKNGVLVDFRSLPGRIIHESDFPVGYFDARARPSPTKTDVQKDLFSMSDGS